MDTVVVELATLVVVMDDVVRLSTVVVAMVVVDSDPIEEVREVELVEESSDVDAEDVMTNVDDVDDVSMLVEDVMVADVDVTLVDTPCEGVVVVELAEVEESSEVLDKEVTGDVEAVVAVGAAKVVGVVEDSIDVADELWSVIACDSRAVGAAGVESEINANVDEELITEEVSNC